MMYSNQQGGLLSALGSLALMVWLASTPPSPQTERKRLAILAGFAFLTGKTTMTTIIIMTTRFTVTTMTLLTLTTFVTMMIVTVVTLSSFRCSV